jgi:hypothetical protein
MPFSEAGALGSEIHPVDLKAACSQRAGRFSFAKSPSKPNFFLFNQEIFIF